MKGSIRKGVGLIVAAGLILGGMSPAFAETAPATETKAVKPKGKHHLHMGKHHKAHAPKAAVTPAK